MIANLPFNQVQKAADKVLSSKRKLKSFKHQKIEEAAGGKDAVSGAKAVKPIITQEESNEEARPIVGADPQYMA